MQTLLMRAEIASEEEHRSEFDQLGGLHQDRSGPKPAPRAAPRYPDAGNPYRQQHYRGHNHQGQRNLAQAAQRQLRYREHHGQTRGQVQQLALEEVERVAGLLQPHENRWY